MNRFLRELEACLSKATPAQRSEIAGAYLALIRGVAASTRVIGGLFRPSKFAALGLLGALSGAMGAGGAEKLVANLKKTAPQIGPHVTALVSAL